eukprot:SAG31_NODE_21116_length_557_cov_1.351528_1_plen_156_part_01
MHLFADVKCVMPNRRALAAVRLMLVCVGACYGIAGVAASELMVDPNFGPSLAAVDRARSAGRYSSVAAGSGPGPMDEFPGASATALQLLPNSGRTKVVVATMAPPRAADLGYYYVSFYAQLSMAYNGATADVITATVLDDSGGSVLALPLPLRSWR